MPFNIVMLTFVKLKNKLKIPIHGMYVLGWYFQLVVICMKVIVSKTLYCHMQKLNEQNSPNRIKSIDSMVWFGLVVSSIDFLLE